MNCQSIGRNQRSRGFKLKQGLQLALLLALGVWLLYQIKHSLSESKGYGKSVNIKLNEEEHGAVLLGRKGDAGWLSDASSSDPRKGNLVTGSGREVDGKAKDVNNRLASSKEKETEKEIDKPNMVSLNRTDIVSGAEVEEKDKASKLNIEELPREDYTGKGQAYLRKSMLDQDEQGDASDLKTQGSDLEQEEMKMPPDGMENSQNAQNSTDSDQQALLDGVHGFQDENGIPELGNNHLISVLVGARDDQENSLPEETVLTSSNNQSTNGGKGKASAEEVAAFKEKTDDGNAKTSTKDQDH